MAFAYKWYLRMLSRHPWKTQMITAGALMGSGDIICQNTIENKTQNEFEYLRTVKFGTIGTFYVGPVLNTWYKSLEMIFGVSTRSIAVKKMLLDQCGFAPVFLCGFLIIRGVSDQKSWNTIKASLQKDYASVLKANYMVWPAAQLITFYVIPPQQRILFVSTVALFWNTYLAWKTK